MVLVGDNDLLNLDTYAEAIAPNGPCGNDACYSLDQVHELLGQHARSQPHRRRPDRRRRELRHRPHRARPARRRHRRPRRRRPPTQGVGLHRHPQARRRLLRGRLRRARDGPPVRGQPHLQRQPGQLLGGATATAAPRSSPAAARRSWPTPGSAARTTCSRTPTPTSRSAASRRSPTYVGSGPGRRRRGADRGASPLRRRQRDPARDLRPRLQRGLLDRGPPSSVQAQRSTASTRRRSAARPALPSATPGSRPRSRRSPRCNCTVSVTGASATSMGFTVTFTAPGQHRRPDPAADRL